MTPERWKLIEDAFDRAIDLGIAERTAFLDTACGDDDELRHEVEFLLACSTRASDRLHETIARGAEQLEHAAIANKLSTRLGAYRVTELLGEGGMGAVYLASRDDAEYRREVAIKILHPTAASPMLASRLRDERQLLASLDHPNIVRLLDGGSTDEGLPYLVMEYIDGVPLTAYARELPVRARIELAIQVASAVQYAHQKLVVHRDVKPSNILVDSGGIPHLLDFGIAKLLDDTADDRDARTRTGMLMFTAEYASPEQARGEATSVATDVYSLGAVLYDILTGRPPQRRGDTVVETLTNICDREPALPSAVAPREIQRELVGDLDNIVLKALQKSAPARYPSAAALVDDLERYLDGLPVTARAATPGYRARKYLRRHAAKLALAALIAVGLTTATVISVLQARRADRSAAAAVEDNQRLLLDRGIQELAAGHPTRALPYLDAVLRAGVDTPALRFLIADALRPLEADVAVLTPAEGARGTAWAPDGTRFAVALQSGKLVVHAIDGTKLTEMSGPTSYMMLLAFDREGATLVAAFVDGSLVGWDAATGAQKYRIVVGMLDWTVTWSSTPTAVIAARHDGAVTVIDIQTGRELATTSVPFSSSWQFRVALSPDRRAAAIGLRTGELFVWNLISSEVRRVAGHVGGVTALRYSRDGSKLFTGGADGVVQVRHPTGAPLHTLVGASGDINVIEADPSGARLVTISHETATIWDVATAKPISSFGRTERVVGIDWNHNGTRIATQNRTGSFSVWNDRGGLELTFDSTPAAGARGGAGGMLESRFSPDGMYLLTMTTRDVHLRRVDVGPLIAKFAPPGNPYAVAWSPDQQRIAVTGQYLGGIWSASSQRQTANFGLTVAGWDLAWHPDGNSIAVVANDGGAALHEISGAVIRRFIGHSGRITGVAWRGTGEQLITAGSDHTARVWDPATGREVLRLSHPDSVMAARWSPDGTTIATACWDHRLRLWDAETGQLEQTIDAGALQLLSVSFDPSGRTLATTARGGDVVLFDRATGKRLFSLGGHSDAVPVAVWSPDGGLLATAGYDGQLRIWDPSTGALLATRATGPLMSIEWTRDGNRIVDCSEDGFIRIWDVHRATEPVGSLVSTLQRHALFRLVGTQLERLDAWSR